MWFCGIMEYSEYCYVVVSQHHWQQKYRQTLFLVDGLPDTSLDLDGCQPPKKSMDKVAVYQNGDFEG